MRTTPESAPKLKPKPSEPAHHLYLRSRGWEKSEHSNVWTRGAVAKLEPDAFVNQVADDMVAFGERLTALEAKPKRERTPVTVHIEAAVPPIDGPNAAKPKA
jgi:hypothetical protein